MMNSASTTDIQIRDARDRLIDLLGIGQTYPLADLPVPDERLTVAFNTATKITIEHSQPDVLYQLRYKGEPVTRTAQGAGGAGAPIEAQGNGGTIRLETYKIQEDVTFEIYARKQPSGRAVYLHQTATVKVGPNTALRARIVDAEHLDPAADSQADTAARIISYGEQITVEIECSEEGVDYRLVVLGNSGDSQAPAEVTLSAADVSGNQDTIELRTGPIFEDVDIRIRATKTFDPSEQRPTQTALLDPVLPLRVRANMALPVVVPTPITGFQQRVTVNIANTQKSATYQLYVRPVHDHEFVHQPARDAELISVDVTGAPVVQVHRPVGEILAPPAYTAHGSSKEGTGADLQLTTNALTSDSLIIVRAKKKHQVAPDSRPDQTVASAVPLEQAALALVKPDPNPGLRLEVLLGAADQGATIEASYGETGVCYFFNPIADAGDPVPLACGSPLPVDTDLAIYAVKARTRVAVKLSDTIRTPAVSIVDDGATARVRINRSRRNEHYQLWLEGKPLADPVPGNGSYLLLNIDPVKDVTYVLLISQCYPLSVEQWLNLTVQVRPAAS